MEPALSTEMETALLERVVSFFALPATNDMPQILENLNTVLTSVLMSACNIDTITRLLKVRIPVN